MSVTIDPHRLFRDGPGLHKIPASAYPPMLRRNVDGTAVSR